MKRFIKLALVILAVFALPKLSNAQSGGSVYAAGSTLNNVVIFRNSSKDDSAHLFGSADTLNHSYPAGVLLSFNGQPYWWNGVYWFKINGDTSSPVQVNSDWNATTGVAKILNKPTLATVATSGSYTDLSNQPTIPAAQVNSDWYALSGISQILNRPRIIDSIYRVPGKDSIYFQMRLASQPNVIVLYSILDSAGGGGGGGSVDSVFIDNFPPLFNVSVVNQGIKPHFTFNPINVGGYYVLGNPNSSTGAYSFYEPTATQLNAWFGATIQPSITSSNTQIIFNNSSTLTGNNNLEFNPSTNVMCVGCAVTSNLATLDLGGATGSGIIVSDSVKINATNIAQIFTSSTERVRVDNSGNVYMFSLSSGQPTDSVMTINPSTGKIGYASRNLTLYAVQGLKNYGNSGDSIGIGGFLFMNDSINLNFYGLYLQNMINKSSLLSTDSLVGITSAGELFKIASSGAGGGGGGNTIYTGDGTLAGNRTVSGGANSLSLGSGGSPLSSLVVNSSGALQYVGGLYNSVGGSQVLVQAATINNGVTAASGTVTNFAATYFGQPTITSTNASVTYNNPATVYIQGQPIISTNSSSTTPYSLVIGTGTSLFGGSILVDSNAVRTVANGTNNLLSVNTHQVLSNNNQLFGVGSGFTFQWNINGTQEFKILTTGQAQFGSGSNYGSGAFTGTPTEAAAFTSTGLLIESPITGTGNNVYSISPALTGSPTAPTQSPGTSNTTLATTAFVANAINSGALTSQSITGGASATGTTISSGKLRVTFNFSSTVSAFTFTMPSLPFDGEEVDIESGGSLAYPTYEITTLTMVAGTGTFGQTAPLATLQANEDAVFVWNATLSLWMRRY